MTRLLQTHADRASRRIARLSRRDVWLGIAALVPMLLIGYALTVSLLAPNPDAILVLGALLITAVTGVVVRDIAAGLREAARLPVRVRSSRVHVRH
ncbi:MAG TPA: hypothetical protein VLA89_13030 [Gemmatimonadales bacterium]|nr:hypothetical protein [Gemmatimonadales bacterium]